VWDRLQARAILHSAGAFACRLPRYNTTTSRLYFNFHQLAKHASVVCTVPHRYQLHDFVFIGPSLAFLPKDLPLKHWARAAAHRAFRVGFQGRRQCGCTPGAHRAINYQSKRHIICEHMTTSSLPPVLGDYSMNGQTNEIWHSEPLAAEKPPPQMYTHCRYPDRSNTPSSTKEGWDIVNLGQMMLVFKVQSTYCGRELKGDHIQMTRTFPVKTFGPSSVAPALFQIDASRQLQIAYWRKALLGFILDLHSNFH